MKSHLIFFPSIMYSKHLMFQKIVLLVTRNHAGWCCVVCMQDLEPSWRLVLATVIGFLGSACGTVGGVGGGGIFVPMLNLLLGFDTKSAAALSKCTKLTLSLVTNFLYFVLLSWLWVPKKWLKFVVTSGFVVNVQV